MSDELSLWNNGGTRSAILNFVQRVCDQDSPEYVHEAERIAVFDNDGCLWCEQPFYAQGLFLFDRLRMMAKHYPEWARTQPYQAVLEEDWHTLAEGGSKSILDLAVVAHGGLTDAEFETLARDWLETSRHPTLGRAYTDLAFQPMVELLGFLRKNRFKTFIVSGGGIEFIRLFSEQVYGIPPEQVVGSSIVTKYEVRDGVPVLARTQELNFIDDGEGKPVGIQQHIGRRPIAAFGNSDGDLQMLEWTLAGDGARLGMFVHHDDAEREFAYDRKSPAGHAEKILDEAVERGLARISMKHDWKQVFS